MVVLLRGIDIVVSLSESVGTTVDCEPVVREDYMQPCLDIIFYKPCQTHSHVLIYKSGLVMVSVVDVGMIICWTVGC